MDILTYAAMGITLGTALIGGVFLTFSDFVMPSLVAAEKRTGAEAMQIINREVFRSIFMILFLGLVPASFAMAAYGVYALSGPVVITLIAGALAYVLGVFGVTAFGNVPMNQRLAGFADGGAEAQAYWADYAPGWTRWNSVRTMFAVVSSVFYLIAVAQLAGA